MTAIRQDAHKCCRQQTFSPNRCAGAADCVRRDQLDAYWLPNRLSLREQQSVERDLRLALERGEFELYFQPKVELSSGAISGGARGQASG